MQTASSESNNELSIIQSHDILHFKANQLNQKDNACSLESKVKIKNKNSMQWENKWNIHAQNCIVAEASNLQYWRINAVGI